MQTIPIIRLAPPPWLNDALRELREPMSDPRARMRLCIRLARLNIEHGTGGPFGAAVFERDTGRLVAAGANVVAAQHCSAAHAEIMALTAAQQMLHSYDLGAEGLPAHELVTSTEPCAMCLGAVPWSGVRRVVCGARHEDAARIGMDEGAKPADWAGALARRGIEVVRDVCRRQAADVLRDYARRGGTIYNGRGGAGVSGSGSSRKTRPPA